MKQRTHNVEIELQVFDKTSYEKLIDFFIVLYCVISGRPNKQRLAKETIISDARA